MGCRIASRMQIGMWPCLGVAVNKRAKAKKNEEGAWITLSDNNWWPSDLACLSFLTAVVTCATVTQRFPRMLGFRALEIWPKSFSLPSRFLVFKRASNFPAQRYAIEAHPLVPSITPEVLHVDRPSKRFTSVQKSREESEQRASANTSLLRWFWLISNLLTAYLL